MTRHLALVERLAPPIARVTAVHVDRRGVRSVTVACPFGCRRPHVHGWPPGDAEVGERSAHCHPQRPGASYLVVGAPASAAGDAPPEHVRRAAR